ncbi:ATP-binding protein [Pseudomarimonas arenosa]|uniref:histidine kinase n=1 Tax=Pseudomarimonas arenosa TaxID=2774145 RepID=A0AAW3ZLG8_9GAMM|nr:ATP-binding protein [Pseudomarimonas arenosa]MBD8525760.1 hypothetical protein [Pseudomarimonas arenosa]
MTIKLRILLIVLLLELAGYGILLAHNHHTSAQALTELRGKQIEALFAANLARIDAQTDLMERSARDLAVAGQHLFRQRPAELAVGEDAGSQALLTQHFDDFPAAIGGGLWYEPYAFSAEQRLFGPYAYRQQDRVVFSWELNSEDYNYPQQSWYLHALPADWPRDRPRPSKVYWTEPYFDEAGSKALMMTVDALMQDESGHLIGMATVDWSMEGMRRFVADMQVTPGSQSFLIDRQSGRFVNFSPDPEQVMQPARDYAWAAHALGSADSRKVGRQDTVDVQGQPHIAFYMSSKVGLIFGVLVPEAEFTAELQAMLRDKLLVGGLISLAFILLMMLMLNVLFRPFNRMLRSISHSIGHHPEDGRLQLTPLPAAGRNEFAPIIAALNEVYQEVEAYTLRLDTARRELEEGQDEIYRLNATLEAKVEERTAELETRNEQLRSTISELRAAQAQLVEAEKHLALNRLVTGVAHEINSPLGVAVTAQSLLDFKLREFRRHFEQQPLRRSELEEFLRICDETVLLLGNNLSRVADQVRSFRQISLDQSRELRRRFDVADYLRDVLLSLSGQLKQGGHEAELDCPEALVIDSYPGALSQIVTQLIGNSLLHGFQGQMQGRIRIGVRSLEDGGIELSYRDNGVGIPPEHLSQVFDPFFTTRRHEGSSGLGLHLIYTLVTRRLQGQVQCESRPGHGVRFVFVLPRLPAEAVEVKSESGLRAEPDGQPVR